METHDAILGGLEGVQNGLGARSYQNGWPVAGGAGVQGWWRWRRWRRWPTQGAAEPQNVANNTIVATIYKRWVKTTVSRLSKSCKRHHSRDDFRNLVCGRGGAEPQNHANGPIVTTIRNEADIKTVTTMVYFEGQICEVISLTSEMLDFAFSPTSFLRGEC